MTQLILNSRIIIETEKSIFYTNTGRHANMFDILRKSSQMKIVIKNVKKLKRVHKEISKNIEL